MALRHFEGAAFRRARAALDVVEGLRVGRDQAGAGAALDRHVADGHAPFHGERADRLAGIFDDMAGAAGGADLADDGEDDVLGGDAVGQLAVDAHPHVLRLVLDQRLGGQHMLDLGRADAVRQRAEGAMRRGMAVAADDGRAGQGEALLGPDHMDDALALVALVVIFDAEIAGVLAPACRSAAPTSGSSMPLERSVVGTLWSTTASVFSGARTLRPAMRRPSKACGLVTSCTRWRSI